MANYLRTDLVLEALEMAINQRKPLAVIHHSDQGSQYTSLAFGKRCREAGVRSSPHWNVSCWIGIVFDREIKPEGRCLSLSRVGTIRIAAAHQSAIDRR